MNICSVSSFQIKRELVNLNRNFRLSQKSESKDSVSFSANKPMVYNQKLINIFSSGYIHPDKITAYINAGKNNYIGTIPETVVKALGCSEAKALSQLDSLTKYCLESEGDFQWNPNCKLYRLRGEEWKESDSAKAYKMEVFGKVYCFKAYYNNKGKDIKIDIAKFHGPQAEIPVHILLTKGYNVSDVPEFYVSNLVIPNNGNNFNGWSIVEFIHPNKKIEKKNTIKMSSVLDILRLSYTDIRGDNAINLSSRNRSNITTIWVDLGGIMPKATANDLIYNPELRYVGHPGIIY